MREKRANRSRTRVMVVPCVVILNGQGKVLILRRGARKRYSGKWELPGGRLRFGESPREAACRELREETGFCIDPKSIVSVDTYSYTYGNKRSAVQFVIPLYVSKAEGEPVLTPEEHDDWCWMTLEEIKELEERGETLTGVYEMVMGALKRAREVGLLGS
ncbi:MAG: hypothetical protein DRO05_05880 [Thermoproteota archaeon]|nr:MAG: hypothetical protein DRO05_05880 [Candidatus Korarchaeota archaeon]